MDKNVIEYREKYHRCRYCKYCETVVIGDIHEYTRCWLKKKHVELKPYSGFCCKWFQVGDDNSI